MFCEFMQDCKYCYNEENINYCLKRKRLLKEKKDNDLKDSIKQLTFNMDILSEKISLIENKIQYLKQMVEK